MQTEVPHQLDRPHSAEFREIPLDAEPPVSLSHFTHVLRSYRNVIALSMVIVGLAYAVVAIAIYLMAPAARVTTQPFRLDFEGATEGKYPNGSKFNIADIVSGPILSRVFKNNHLDEYMTSGDFSRSLFVLESNRQYETLAAEYEALLADPKLTSVDRQRLQNEFEMKRQSIAKNEYAISFSHPRELKSIPDVIVRKTLLDALNAWADFAVNQQHVITYDVAVLSPAVLNDAAMTQDDVIARIALLRAKANQAIDTIDVMSRLPGARLARTTKDNQSLQELRLRIDDVVRFDLEPLQSMALRSPAIVSDRARASQFLDNQLAYDQRQLDGIERKTQAIRDAIAIYQRPMEITSPAGETAQPSARGSKEADRNTSEAVPQLSDTFLDRLMSITAHSGDFEYRQRIANDYRKAAEEAIPLQKAVAYDKQMLAILSSGDRGGKLDVAQVDGRVDLIRKNLTVLFGELNDLFAIISRNMTASGQLFSVNGTASTHTFRSIDIIRLGLYGVLLLLIALPVVVIACLLHNRVREEEAAAHSAP
jgi:hypothetical protein